MSERASAARRRAIPGGDQPGERIGGLDRQEVQHLQRRGPQKTVHLHLARAAEKGIQQRCAAGYTLRARGLAPARNGGRIGIERDVLLAGTGRHHHETDKPQRGILQAGKKHETVRYCCPSLLSKLKERGKEFTARRSAETARRFGMDAPARDMPERYGKFPINESIQDVSLHDIQTRIAKAEAAAGRAPGGVTLIAVSKMQPDAHVQAVLEAGHRVFGENRVQEAAGKWPGFRNRFDGIELHLIGPLQTNKARQAMDLAQAIHSVDRPKLARTLARLAQEEGHCPDIFIQINTGEEPQKAGVLPAETDAFVTQCRALDLPVAGVMCIPPVNEEPSLHFALLAKIAARNGLTGLSMGMSADFERAIAQGATHVRVGSAIFGARDHD